MSLLSSPLLSATAKRVIDAVYPPQCPACSAIVEDHGHLCMACWSQIRFIGDPACPTCGVPLPYDPGDDAQCLSCIDNPPHFDQARAVMLYDSFSRGLVLKFKHSDRLDPAGVYAGWMMRAGSTLMDISDLVVPVPLHRTRLFSRRYNQSAVLAQQISRLTRIPYHPEILVRTRRTPSQGTLNRNHRAKNVRGAFTASDDAVGSLDGRTVLLIDDVVTTGATADACAVALKQAGASRVLVLALARVASPGDQTIYVGTLPGRRLMAEIQIYTSMFCGYCARAKQLLKKKGVTFDEIGVDMKPNLRAEMRERAGGVNSVPQIFIDGTHVGGCDELHMLDLDGKLDPMLAT